MTEPTLCRDETCPLRMLCWRNPASGTVPAEGQPFFFTKRLWSKRKLKTATATGEAIMCPYYWRAPEKPVATLPSLPVDFVALEERN